MMKTQGWIALLSLLLVGLAGCGNRDRIVIGSKKFTEQVILGELIAQHIEARTGLEVDRRLNLGGTFICHEGLIAGQLDIYVEYTAFDTEVDSDVVGVGVKFAF